MMMMMMMKSIGMVVLLGGTAQVIGTSQGIPDNAPSTYVDDIYHCLDPKDVDGQYFISCNPNTFLWETKELTTDLPLICAQHFNSRGEDLPTVRTNIIDGGDDNDNDINIPDHLEPCILWTMRSIFPRYLEEEQSSSKNNNTDGKCIIDGFLMTICPYPFRSRLEPFSPAPCLGTFFSFPNADPYTRFLKSRRRSSGTR